jgi:tellurite methyltransferase
MGPVSSVQFFDAQFQRQLEAGELQLNPFEQLALGFVHGNVLDYGCGLGNLAVAAARKGCSVVALDASRTAIAHLRALAQADSLALEAHEADLRTHHPSGEYDAVVCIGLLMFFDCATASSQLEQLKACVRPGGVAVVNVLVEGTTYLGMFDAAAGHCLFAPEELHSRFPGWQILRDERQEFAAPGGTVKHFATVVAARPGPRPPA